MYLKHIILNVDEVEIKIKLGFFRHKITVDGQKVDTKVGLRRGRVEFDLQTDDETIAYELDERNGARFIRRPTLAIWRKGKKLLQLIGIRGS